MPIETAVPIHVFDQESYHQIDKHVTGIAFDIHNDFGRYLDERLYRREFTRRCRETGLSVNPEMQIAVSRRDFVKYYYVDHLVNQGVVIESKAVAALAPAHRGQTLNYLFLCGLHHGTLFNFRTERVQHEFVSTRLTAADRKRLEFNVDEWNPMTPACQQLYDLMRDLLEEWGGYLDPILYRDALTHFLGGEERIHREVEICSGAHILGTQKMHLLTDEIAFSVTTSTHHPETVYLHQRRFLQHTRLRAIQWINLNHALIEFRTITK